MLRFCKVILLFQLIYNDYWISGFPQNFLEVLMKERLIVLLYKHKECERNFLKACQKGIVLCNGQLSIIDTNSL